MLVVQYLILPVGGTPASLQDSVVVAWVAKAVSEAEGHHKRYREYLLQDLPRLCPTYLDESWVSCLLQPPGEFPSVPPPSETPNGLSFVFHIHSFDAEQHSLSFICVFCFLVGAFTFLLLFAKLLVSPGSSARL